MDFRVAVTEGSCCCGSDETGFQAGAGTGVGESRQEPAELPLRSVRLGTSDDHEDIDIADTGQDTTERNRTVERHTDGFVAKSDFQRRRESKP